METTKLAANWERISICLGLSFDLIDSTIRVAGDSHRTRTMESVVPLSVYYFMCVWYVIFEIFAYFYEIKKTSFSLTEYTYIHAN